MAEAVQQANLLPGDLIDIAFTLESNDHDEYGGLELSLRDFRAVQPTAETQPSLSSNQVTS
jgi:hypothetical protein